MPAYSYSCVTCASRGRTAYTWCAFDSVVASIRSGLTHRVVGVVQTYAFQYTMWVCGFLINFALGWTWSKHSKESNSSSAIIRNEQVRRPFAVGPAFVTSSLTVTGRHNSAASKLSTGRPKGVYTGSEGGLKGV
eukprot:6656288-Pyramimonas_sp.AAC.1